ncbi:glyoxalase [Gordonia sp. TBRC 11910]|uniref:Glyoxalase n=1 Tax=Gordonia asplenii TaxID=2725283 RepID=A0A848KTW2_9ACTN|nr:VOC family protein [Gordonia asplenii]NMO01712.1 glyoxalase [Gordonia asplenii]
MNLPTADVARAREFFSRIGFTLDALTSDDGTLVVQVGSSRVVLLRCERFAGYAAAPTGAGTRRVSSAMLAVAVDERADVDRIVGRALRLGARPIRTVDDAGFMYSRSFRDLDGHGWDVVWMDPTQLVGDD